MSRTRKPSTKAKKIIERLDRVVASSNKVSFYPLVVKEGHDCTVTDIDGNTYLDFNASWTTAGVGYSNPEVVKAIEEELEQSTGLASLCRHANVKTVEFAEMLVGLTPGNFKKKVWIGHSGSDACAAAYKLLPLATKKDRVLTFYGGYYGSDLAGMAMGGHPMSVQFKVPGLVAKVPYAYCYRCPFGLEYPSCGVFCASEFIENQTFKYVAPPDDTSFMMVEAIQGDSGDIVPPERYLQKLQRTCRKYGISFCVDECKTGFGRTGKMFAVEHEDSVIPDVMALGKSIASGFPVGALVGRRELMDTGLTLTTLSGNSIGAAAGLATMQVIRKKKLVDNAYRQGRYLRKRLDELKERHDMIGDVRGKGLFFGIELVKDRKTKEPARKETAEVALRAWQLGLIIAYMGADFNVLEITPPLTIDESQIDHGIEILDNALTYVAKSRAR